MIEWLSIVFSFGVFSWPHPTFECQLRIGFNSIEFDSSWLTADYALIGALIDVLANTGVSAH